MKANRLIEMRKKDTKHPGLKKVIIQDIVETTEFNKRHTYIIQNILKVIEEFVDKSSWKKPFKLGEDLFNLKLKA